jgi:uncharacterized protein YjcR
MMKPRLRLLDTEALAFHFGVAPGTIRRWASEDHWHPYGTRRHRQWSVAAAQKSRDDRNTPNETRDCA